MAITPRVSRALAIGLGAGIVTVTGCAPAEQPAIEPQAGLESNLPVPQGAAEQVE